MDIFLIFLAFVLALVGIAGAIVPGLPGPPISFLGILALHYSSGISYTESMLFNFGILAVVITLLDYYVPIYGTKKFGGSRAGVIGSTVGLLFSIFILPFTGIVLGPFGLVGILLGPFVGAWVGETMAGTNRDQAIRAAFGSFISFLAGTLMKLVYAIWVLVLLMVDVVKWLL